ncbi:MAG: leucyl aminopeptidase [Candidatus Gastranaerophilales bacterium]|nr:leucyl aminopeptidase [Candidatus Gastranaerophilales bacterium]
MEIKAQQTSVIDVACDVLIINLFEGVKIPGGATGVVDNTLGGIITNYVIKEQGFSGKFADTYVLDTNGKIPAKKVLIIGLGKQEDFDLNKLIILSSKMIRKCEGILNAKKIATILHGGGLAALDAKCCAKAITTGLMIGAYKFNKYKSEKQEDKSIDEVIIVEQDPAKVEKIKEGMANAKSVANAVNFAKDLVNEPASYMTPDRIAEIATDMKKIETRIIDEDEARQMGMGAFLAVGKGSSKSPVFIHMKYRPSKKKKSIAIVGKGITFDSGGLDLKPTAGMATMKGDMAGAACVLGVFKALIELNPNVEVHGVIAACENMPGSRAYKPGDILTAMNGKTIEVDNTDAEGRLTLADALSYAVDLNVDEVIDIATLTGACSVALGALNSGVFGNNRELIDDIIEASKQAGEHLWQMPMDEEYFEDLKSDIADFKNSGSRGGGASGAALFLKQFVGEIPWVHLDIAGTSIISKDLRENKKGPTGVGVRTLINYICS